MASQARFGLQAIVWRPLIQMMLLLLSKVIDTENHYSIDVYITNSEIAPELHAKISCN